MGKGIKNTQEEFIKRINDISPTLDISGTYTTLEKTILECRCKICGHEWQSSAKNLLKPKKCVKCHFKSLKFQYPDISNKEFCEMVLENYPDIIVNGNYKYGQNEITCTCKKCGYKSRIRTNTLLDKTYKCKMCEYGKENIKIGINDIKSINPVLYDCLADKSVNEKYNINSRNKTDFICPCCNNIIRNKSIYDANTRGLRCKCQDGNSLGEKYFYQVIKSVDENVEVEKHLNNNMEYRYDFYGEINNKTWICEIQGKQHTEKSFHTLGGRTLEEEIENDIRKKEYALSQNIDYYIQIYSKNSGFNQFKQAILNSQITELYDLSNVDWVECYRKSLMSDVFVVADYWNNGYKVMEICDLLHIGKGTVRQYLTRANDIGYCKYDHTRNTRKYVKCIETGEIFKSFRDAERKYNIKRGYISSWLKGRITLPVGNLTWKYIENINEELVA